MPVSSSVVGVITAASQTYGPWDTSPGIGVLVFQITGTWTGTIVFKCGNDNVTVNAGKMLVWEADAGPQSSVDTTTANGTFATIDATGKNCYVGSTSATWTGTAVINMSLGSVGH